MNSSADQKPEWLRNLRIAVAIVAVCGGVLGSATVAKEFVWPSRLGGHHRPDTKMIIKNIEVAVVLYQTDHTDACPASLEALANEKYLTKVRTDEWGQPLLFLCPGANNRDGADVLSSGPDETFGTPDDIKSWEF